MISPVGHVIYFTSTTLGRCLSEHGFSVVNKRYPRRFPKAPLQNLVYQAIVFLENNLALYPHTLSLYARKV